MHTSPGALNLKHKFMRPAAVAIRYAPKNEYEQTIKLHSNTLDTIEINEGKIPCSFRLATHWFRCLCPRLAKPEFNLAPPTTYRIMKLFTPLALVAILLLGGPVTRAQRPAPVTAKPAATRTKTNAAAHRLPTTAELKFDYLGYRSVAIRIADRKEYDDAIKQYRTEISAAPVAGDSSYSFAMGEIELLVVWVPVTVARKKNCIIGYRDWASIKNIDTMRVYYDKYLINRRLKNEEAPGSSLKGGRDLSKNTVRALYKPPIFYIKSDKGFTEFQPFRASYLAGYSKVYEGVIINPPVP